MDVYSSIAQRKALTPNDLGSPLELARYLMDFGQHYAVTPFARLGRAAHERSPHVSRGRGVPYRLVLRQR